LLFDDGETAFMTDGFFSRPRLTSVLFSRVEPDERAIDAGLASLGVRCLAAVVTMHAHYDHAMDAPLVARKTGALLVGDESTMNLGRSAGLAAGSMRKVSTGDTIELGRWRMTFIASRHAPTPFSDGTPGERIEAPLTPPAKATAWREGETWSLLVEHRSGRSYLVQGSAGFIKGALSGRKADVVFLGVGAVGKQTTDYRARLWAEVPKAVGAKRVIPVHWDDFWQALDHLCRRCHISPTTSPRRWMTLLALRQLTASTCVCRRSLPRSTPHPDGVPCDWGPWLSIRSTSCPVGRW
jgi:L-ascorbate metabolism protein UlaG (beta-lactamase superfamily)